MQRVVKFFAIFFCIGSLYSNSLTKAGAGTCTLSGDSSVTLPDPFVLSAGTLQVSAGNNIGSNTGSFTMATATLHVTGNAFSTGRTMTLTGDALVDIDLGTTTFSGVISGTGSLTKSNTTATLSLTNSNSYAGGTTINGGILSLGALNALPNGKDLTLNNSAEVQCNNHDQTLGALTSTSTLTEINLGSATLTVGSGSFSGVISSTGNLVKTGSGTLTLLGANTYSGGTTVEGGSLLGNATSLQNDTPGRSITNRATLIFNQTIDGSFGNVIDGTTGILRKQGAGKLVLSGLTTQDQVIVEAGNLQLASGNFLSASTVTVNSGAVFSGNGFAGTGGGTFSNFGTVSPGASIGTLFIFGNYTQEAGSTLEIELSPTQTDKLDVSGSVTIQSGTTLALFPTPGQYSPLTTYEIVQSGTGRSGTFSTVTSSLPAFNGEVIYTSTAVLLLINEVPFSNLIVEGNAAAVARCLDQLSSSNDSDIQQVIQSLQFMTVEQMSDTMDQMNSSLYNALDLSQEQTMVEIGEVISRRLSDFQRKSCADPMQMDLWGNFLYTRSRQNGQGENVGFNTRTQGGIGGFDAHLFQDMLIGGCFVCTEDHVNWKQQRGSSKIQSYSGGIYIGGENPYFYYQGSLMGFYDDFQGKRKIVFPTTLVSGSTRVAQSSGKGWGTSSFVELAFMPLEQRAEIFPFARADYVFLQRFAFQEQEAGSINLDVNSQLSDLFRSEIGLKLLTCHFYKPLLSLHAKASWGFETHFLGKYSKANFAISDCVMKVKGLSPTRSFFGWGAGFDVRGGEDHLMVGAEVDGEWSDNYWEYAIEVQVKLGF